MDHIIDRRRALALAAGAAATTAIGGPAFAQRSRTFNWTPARPESVGMSTAGLTKINTAMQALIDGGKLTGAVTAVARRGKLVHYQAHGIRDAETGAAMRKDDIFRMMSSTKPTIGVAVLMMMEAGKLSIDDKVSRFIPEFVNAKVATLPPGVEMPRRAAGNAEAEATGAPAGDQQTREALAKQVTLVPCRDITIKDLMTHTSGLSSGGAGSLVNRIQRRPGDKLADYIPRLGAAELDFTPGSRWRYSASDGIDVLGRIVEITSGVPLDIFLRERLHEPLDMRDTGFNIPAAKYNRILTMYRRSGANWRPSRASFGYAPAVYFSGAGGSMSTAHDYMQFEQMLLNKGELNGRRILKPETVALMSTNHTGDLYGGTNGSTGGTGFGLTVRVVKDPVAAKTGRSAGAFGWAGAYGTTSWTDPKEDLTAALMVQQPGTTALSDFEYAIRGAIVS